jgi:MerT mercuric transport protein
MKTGKQLSAIGSAAVGTGAALTAGVASACCVGPALAPFFVAVLGAGGLAAVSGLRPYTPWMLLASGALLGLTFRQVYRPTECGTQSSPTTLPAGLRVARVIAWAAAAFWLASTIFATYGFFHE